MPSLLPRCPLLLFNVSYRLGELVQACSESVEEPQDRVPANAASASLDLGDVGRTDVEPGSQVLLGQPGVITHGLEHSTEQKLVLDRVTHLSTFSHVGLPSGNTKIVPPRCCRSRGRGTVGISYGARATLPDPQRCTNAAKHLRRLQPRRNRPMTTIPAEAVIRLREALYSQARLHRRGTRVTRPHPGARDQR